MGKVLRHSIVNVTWSVTNLVKGKLAKLNSATLRTAVKVSLCKIEEPVRTCALEKICVCRHRIACGKHKHGRKCGYSKYWLYAPVHHTTKGPD